MDALINLKSLNDIFFWLYVIFTILIFVLGFYVYFKVEKDRKTLLIALGFLFFFLASLSGVLDFLNNSILSPWDVFFNFLGALMVLIAVEPWKALNK